MYMVNAIHDFQGKSSIQQEDSLPPKNWQWYTWNIALYGAETWKLQKTDQKHLEFSANGAAGG